MTSPNEPVAKAEHSIDQVEGRPAFVVPSFDVVGTRVHAVQFDDVIRIIEQWIAEGKRAHFVSVANAHVVTEARRNPSFRAVIDASDLCVPDGSPLIWVGRRRGYRLARRVYGPDLLIEFCSSTAHRGYRHFFYGGAPGVAEQLGERLQTMFPGVLVAGTYSPPFRPLTPEEDATAVQLINDANPDVLWVGLGAPKQERWIYDHLPRLRVPAVLAVGQAFDIQSGRVRPAPAWMAEHGLEWLYRLAKEPRRLWRRYLLYNSEFLCYLLLDYLHPRRSN